jgi:hypothetical protein
LETVSSFSEGVIGKNALNVAVSRNQLIRTVTATAKLRLMLLPPPSGGMLLYGAQFT